MTIDKSEHNRAKSETGGCIYELVHPTSGRCIYVGETTTDISTRLMGHVTASVRGEDKNSMLQATIRTLKDLGLSPSIREIERLPDDASKSDRLAREQHWIETRKAEGFELCNRVAGIKVGYKFEEGTGPNKLKGRKRPELAAKLTGREVSEEHGQNVSSALKERTRRMKADGSWDSEEQRRIRSEKVKASWAQRRLNRQSRDPNGPEATSERENRSKGQLERRAKARITTV